MYGPWERGRWERDMGRGRGSADAWAGVWNEWWRGPAPRAQRGAVRWLVLDAIAAQPRHGYEIIQAIGEKSGGAYRPSPGVVYPTLQMLEELGHARTASRDERKVYEITDAGRSELQAHTEEVAEFYDAQPDGAPWEDYAEDLAYVMKRVGRLVRVFKRSVHRGSMRPTTMRKVRKVLDEALGKLEELLTQEEL